MVPKVTSLQVMQVAITVERHSLLELRHSKGSLASAQISPAQGDAGLDQVRGVAQGPLQVGDGLLWLPLRDVIAAQQIKTLSVRGIQAQRLFQFLVTVLQGIDGEVQLAQGAMQFEIVRLQ